MTTALETLARQPAGRASPWLDADDAAAYTGFTVGTLKTWRCRGRGPRYHVVNGRLIRYHVSDLDAFMRGESSR